MTRVGLGLAVMVCGMALTASSMGEVGAQATIVVSQRKVRKTAPAPAAVAPVEVAPVVAAPVVEPPPVPLTPGQMPPNPPTVTFVDGMLSIAAENSTLADILMAVKTSTGTTMDMPGGAGADRVWVTLGPGPARSVLAALLAGTSLDYVIQASDSDPSQIQSVLLTPRMKSGQAVSGSDPNSFSARYHQFMNRPNYGTEGGGGEGGAVTDTPNGEAEGGVPMAASEPAAEAPATARETPIITPNQPLAAHLPVTISEAEAHPAPVADPTQAIPQMQNLFELRRQLQAQQNAEQKVTGTR